jgi:hypothetical protein
VGEVIGFAAGTGASLIVLSPVTAAAARLAAGEARQIREHLPRVRVLIGRPGDALVRLRDLARSRPPESSPERPERPEQKRPERPEQKRKR